MADRSYDPTNALRFDVASGSVRLVGGVGGGDARDARAEDVRVVVLPCEALQELATSDLPGVLEGLGHLVGRVLGRRLGAKLGARATSGTVEDFVTEIAGELAVLGYGAVRLERWGRALVLVVDGSGLPVRMIAPMLGALVEGATGREVWCTQLMTDDTSTRVLVSSRAAINRVRGWLDEGVVWGDALTRLHTHARSGAQTNGDGAP